MQLVAQDGALRLSYRLKESSLHTPNAKDWPTRQRPQSRSLWCQSQTLSFARSGHETQHGRTGQAQAMWNLTNIFYTHTTKNRTPMPTLHLEREETPALLCFGWGAALKFWPYLAIRSSRRTSAWEWSFRKIILAKCQFCLYYFSLLSQSFISSPKLLCWVTRGC